MHNLWSISVNRPGNNVYRIFSNRWLANGPFCGLLCALLLPAAATAQAPKSIDDSYWICSYDFKTAVAKRLFAVPELHSASSVSYSPDQDRVLFDGSVPGRHSTSSSHIFVCKPDGSEMQDLGPGRMPSWSPRGQRIAFSRYSPEHGVWLMNADGSDDRLLDNQGWSAKWSPNGHTIAYVRELNGTRDIVLFNLVEDEITALFGEHRSEYQPFESMFAWSPDSQHLCMVSLAQDDATLTTVSLDNPPKVKALMSDESLSMEFAWMDESHILTPQYSSKTNQVELHRLNASDSGQPVLEMLPGLFVDRLNTDYSVSRSGDTMLFISSRPKN